MESWGEKCSQGNSAYTLRKSTQPKIIHDSSRLDSHGWVVLWLLWRASATKFPRTLTTRGRSFLHATASITATMPCFSTRLLKIMWSSSVSWRYDFITGNFVPEILEQITETSVRVSVWLLLSSSALGSYVIDVDWYLLHFGKLGTFRVCRCCGKAGFDRRGICLLFFVVGFKKRTFQAYNEPPMSCAKTRGNPKSTRHRQKFILRRLQRHHSRALQNGVTLGSAFPNGA